MSDMEPNILLLNLSYRAIWDRIETNPTYRVFKNNLMRTQIQLESQKRTSRISHMAVNAKGDRKDKYLT